MPAAGYSPNYELDFESAVQEIDRQIDALESKEDFARFASEIQSLRNTRNELLRKIVVDLS
jgi:acetyl-CoA carboxylase alpha subunit